MADYGMPASAERLGTNYGNRLYELTRARLASGAQANRRNLSRLYAGRGQGSSAMASAGRTLLADETRATADASLEAQLGGTQLGFQEAGRLDQNRQFDANLNQQDALTRFQAEQERIRQERDFAFQREMQRRENKRGLLGGVLGAAGSLAGNFLLPGIGGLLGGALGGGGGGNSGGGLYSYLRARG